MTPQCTMIHYGLPVQSLTRQTPDGSWETLLWVNGSHDPVPRYTIVADSAGVSFRNALDRVTGEIESGVWPEALAESAWARSLHRVYQYMQEHFPDE